MRYRNLRKVLQSININKCLAIFVLFCSVFFPVEWNLVSQQNRDLYRHCKTDRQIDEQLLKYGDNDKAFIKQCKNLQTYRHLQYLFLHKKVSAQASPSD